MHEKKTVVFNKLQIYKLQIVRADFSLDELFVDGVVIETINNDSSYWLHLLQVVYPIPDFNK